MPMLQDKVCIVTGGSGSVGLAAAQLFLAEGASVMLVDLDRSRLAAACAGLDPGRTDTFAGDVSDPASVRGFVEATATRFGAIDVLLSNAGNHGYIGDLADYDEAAFDRTYAVHVKGAFLACKYGPPRMRDGGSIIITASVAGLRGGEGAERNIAYTTVKHAQIGVMRSAARALAPRRIRVNVLSPGPIDNAFQADIEHRIGAVSGIDLTRAIDAAIPLGRHADPTEVANMALFLASSMSSYVTGHVHVVDGGLGS